ncbi:hypothetical protein SDC9_204173 [bioreactor metagenome]|uniref:Uncharacterized protein n=1 Tax=bioreactor metagenome TaxID=1076179 RepID=A0A645JAD9_9ZZZZ
MEACRRYRQSYGVLCAERPAIPLAVLPDVFDVRVDRHVVEAQ